MKLFKSYLIGFVISIILTLAAFVPVFQHAQSAHQAFSHQFLIYWIVIIAIIQALIQLLFFLHLRQASPSSKVILFSTVSIILILVIGSIWIMGHLNYNMTPSDMNNYLMQAEGIHNSPQ